MRYLPLLVLLAGCTTSTVAIERIEGPCTMEKTDSFMWPTISRHIKVECQEGGAAETRIGIEAVATEPKEEN